MSEAIKHTQGIFIKITEFVTQEQLNELKELMSVHIHSDLKESFLDKIDRVFMRKHQKEIGQKLFARNIMPKPAEFCQILHTIMIDIYFGEAGYLNVKFSDQEKLALLGWAFFCDQDPKDKHAPKTWEASILELRTSTSPAFVNSGFEWNLKPRIKLYVDQMLNGPDQKPMTVEEQMETLEQYATPPLDSSSEITSSI